MSTTDIAVKWWTDHLGGAGWGNGDSGQTSLVRMMLSMNPTITDEQRSKFSAALRDQITQHAPSYLSVDYHPDHLLAQACDAAGLGTEIGVLPAKTAMWIDGSKVTVRHGYGASEETLT